MTVESTKEYVSGWRAREKRRVDEAARLVRELESRLPAVREILGRYGVREAYVFGSFASGQPGPGSDLDLAVAGARPATWYAMSAEIERAVGLELDVIDLDSAPAALRDRILASGRSILR